MKYTRMYVKNFIQFRLTYFSSRNIIIAFYFFTVKHLGVLKYGNNQLKVDTGLCIAPKEQNGQHLILIRVTFKIYSLNLLIHTNMNILMKLTCTKVILKQHDNKTSVFLETKIDFEQNFIVLVLFLLRVAHLYI